jgi:YHS domain-containing protein
MKRKRYILFIIGSLFGISIGWGVLSPAWSKSPINTNWRGIAIKGYDPVAYFTQGKPAKGTQKFEYQWNGTKWRFSNPEHLELFKSNPTRYAPQYGGY